MMFHSQYPTRLSAHPTRSARVFRKAGLTVASLSTLALVACSSGVSLVEDPYSQKIDSASGDYPLPSGAYYEAANARAAQGADTDVSLASLAPDNKKPEERVPEIVKRGRIIVGVDQSLNLLSFRDSTTGELAGFEVSLAQEIARDIFGNPNAVEFRYVGSTERIDALKNGTVDVVLRTMTVNSERKAEVSFSAPYLTSRAGILVVSSSTLGTSETTSNELDHKRICVSRASTTEEMLRRIAPNSTLLLVGSWSDCLVAIQNNQAEVVVADDTILAGINDQDPATAIVERGLSTEQYAAGVARHNTGLVRQINATLERLREDGTWQSLYDVWFSPFLPGGQQPFPEYIEETPAAPTTPAPSETAPDAAIGQEGGH